MESAHKVLGSLQSKLNTRPLPWCLRRCRCSNFNSKGAFCQRDGKLTLAYINITPPNSLYCSNVLTTWQSGVIQPSTIQTSLRELSVQASLIVSALILARTWGPDTLQHYIPVSTSLSTTRTVMLFFGVFRLNHITPLPFRPRGRVCFIFSVIPFKLHNAGVSENAWCTLQCTLDPRWFGFRREGLHVIYSTWTACACGQGVPPAHSK